jgi:hypothetical protein
LRSFRRTGYAVSKRLRREALKQRKGSNEQKPCCGGGCDADAVVVCAASVAICRIICLCCRVWRRVALRQARGRLANGAAFMMWDGPGRVGCVQTGRASDRRLESRCKRRSRSVLAWASGSLRLVTVGLEHRNGPLKFHVGQSAAACRHVPEPSLNLRMRRHLRTCYNTTHPSLTTMLPTSTSAAVRAAGARPWLSICNSAPLRQKCFSTSPARKGMCTPTSESLSSAFESAHD